MDEHNDSIAAYRQRLELLRAELSRPVNEISGSRAQLRDEIVGLFRSIEADVRALEALREGVRPLVERYREMFARTEQPAEQVRADHLGSSTYRERGWSALAGGEYQRAIQQLEKAMELDPENSSNRAMLAWACLHVQEWDRARELIEQVLRADAQHSLARTCLGYLRLRENRFAEAIESLSAVVREGTDRTAMLYANLYLGMVYAEREMQRDAQSFFQRALALGPNLTEAYWELGRSYQREGRDDLALLTWKTGAENRFNGWGERCRLAAERMEAAQRAS